MSEDTYQGVPITRLAPRRDYSHERMWLRRSARSAARYPQHKLEALRAQMISNCNRSPRRQT